eukprot:366124-Chlamydomonas_euryale.AAC.15
MVVARYAGWRRAHALCDALHAVARPTNHCRHFWRLWDPGRCQRRHRLIRVCDSHAICACGPWPGSVDCRMAGAG